MASIDDISDDSGSEYDLVENESDVGSSDEEFSSEASDLDDTKPAITSDNWACISDVAQEKSIQLG